MRKSKESETTQESKEIQSFQEIVINYKKLMAHKFVLMNSKHVKHAGSENYVRFFCWTY